MDSIPQSLTRSPKRSPRVVALKALERISEAFTLPDDVRLAVCDALDRIHHRPCRESHQCRVEKDGRMVCIHCPYEVANTDSLILEMRRTALALESGRPYGE